MSGTLPRLPARDPRGHKGTFGTVVVLGGCCEGHAHMIGAPALAAHAALRAGAGLARLLMPATILDAGITIAPSATGVPLAVDSATGSLVAHEAAAEIDRQLTGAACMVVGPGLGVGASQRAIALRPLQQVDVPVVADADALNNLAEIPDLHKDFRARAILTPHPGEYKRLAASLRLSHDPVAPETRPAAAAALAQRLGCIVVLKGSGTVVTDGYRTWVCERGHACLGTAGTGDVLSGLIAGLVAQFVRAGPERAGALSLFDAACLGVQAHAIAGEEWAKRRGAQAGLIAQELADLLPGVLEPMR